MSSHIANARLRPRYSIGLAQFEEDISAAQRLRWRVFAEEGGAQLSSPHHGLDVDRYDAACDHLIVRSLPDGEVVGTYRLLTWERAIRLGGFYSDSEFDLTRLDSLRPAMVELGRSCIAKDHRNGVVIGMLWSGIAQFLEATSHRLLIGCASVPMLDGGQLATAIYREALRLQPIDKDTEVIPRHALGLTLTGARKIPPAEFPPLVKGYLRAGARVCGAPHWDREFNTADFFMLLDLAALEQRYERRFIRPSVAMAV